MRARLAEWLEGLEIVGSDSPPSRPLAGEKIADPDALIRQWRLALSKARPAVALSDAFVFTAGAPIAVYPTGAPTPRLAAVGAAGNRELLAPLEPPKIGEHRGVGVPPLFAGTYSSWANATLRSRLLGRLRVQSSAQESSC